MLLFIGTPEVFVIIIVAILIFGPEKIPEIAKNLGKGIRTLRDTTTDIKNEIIRESAKSNLKKELDKLDLDKEVKQIRKIMDVSEEIEDLTKEIKGTVKRK